MLGKKLASSDLLLLTKIHPPRIHGDVLARQRLLQQMQQGLQRKLTLIAAPAGFGKTTLINHWARQHEARLAWFSLDDDDNDPNRFWLYVIAALQSIEPQLGKVAQDSLLQPGASTEVVLTTLLNDLLNIEEQIVLLLDDYHLISDQSIHESVSFLLEHMPPQLHLIIASRVEPPLPLARLRARREMTELRASDLRFSLDEITTFFSDTIGLNVSPNDVYALENRTEGWIAGLQMAALSMQGRDDISSFIQAFTGSHRHILDYLVEEVLERQPKDIQQFLLRSSVLTLLHGDLCNLLTEQDNGHEVLDYLSRANLFVSRLDDERQWYRYHTLFAEFLRSRLVKHHLDIMPELHRTAAAWYEEHNLIGEAIAQLFLAKKYEDAADLLEKHRKTIFWAQSQWTLMQRWLEALPQQVLEARPILCLSMGWSNLLAGHYDKVTYYAQQTATYLSQTPHPQHDDIYGECLGLQAEVALIEGDTRKALNMCNQALAHLSENSAILRSILVQMQGYVYRSMGQVQQASTVLSQAVELSQQANNRMGMIFALADLGDTRFLQGRLQEAIQTFQRILDLQAHYQSPAFGTAYVGMGNALRERNQLAEAVQFLTDGLEIAEQHQIAGILRPGYVTLARVRWAQGDSDAAMQAMKRAVASAMEQSMPRTLIHVTSHQMLLHIKSGNLRPVAEWIDNYDLSATETVVYQRELQLVVLARYLIADKKPEKAIPLLQRLADSARAMGRFGNLIEDLAILASAYQHCGNQEKALTTLQEALALGATEQFIRSFADEGETMADLIKQLAPHSHHATYIREILEAIDRSAAHASNQDMLFEELSERELEVLRLLAVGLSNREIAEQLIIGNSTVKTHTLNIYRKLDTRNRTEAVTRAQILGII